jgi:hypothetical protein
MHLKIEQLTQTFLGRHGDKAQVVALSGGYADNVGHANAPLKSISLCFKPSGPISALPSSARPGSAIEQASLVFALRPRLGSAV